MNKIRVGIVGLGYWGPNLIRNFSKINGVEVVAGCDLEEKNLERIKKDYPLIHLTRNYDELLSDQTITAISVATPPSTHFALGEKALLANKDVLIEKPLTTKIKDAKKLIALAKKKKKILMVGHTFVYADAVIQIKKYIDKNLLGKIYYYDSTRINLGLLQSDSNVIWDLAPHDLSILSYLFNEKVETVFASGASYISKNYEEVAHVLLTYTSGLHAHIHVSWLSPVKLRTVLIGGSKKMIVYNDLEPSEKIKIYDKSIDLKKDEVTAFTPAYRSGDILIPRINQKESLLNELQHFIDCVKTRKDPLTNGEEGLKVVTMLNAIDQSLKKKKTIKFSSL